MEHLKNLSATDRPREKVVQYGPGTLSDTELLAILLGSGSSGLPVHELAARLLAHIGRLSELNCYSAEQLCKIKGIGPAKAAVLLSAAELAGRQKQPRLTVRITTDDDAIRFVRPLLEGLQILQYILVLLNRQRELLATAELLTATDGLPQLNQVVTLVSESGAYGFGIVRNSAADEQQQKQTEQQLLSDLSAAAKMFGVRFFGLAIVPP
jgi:DNA repair protein RadC